MDPLTAGLDWAAIHWFAILIAAMMASLAVRAVKLLEWFLGYYD